MNVLENIKSGKYVAKYPDKLEIAEAGIDWKVAVAQYHNEQNRLNQIFQKDLEEEFGTQNYSRRQKLFDFAWEEGHSAGWHEVYIWYDRLVEAFVN